MTTTELQQSAISDKEFGLFQQLFANEIGLSLSANKKALVCGRLSKRLATLQLPDFQAYYRLITSPGAHEERQHAIDLITTNETYFFREPKHFDFLKHRVLPRAADTREFKVWSAASSTGEEAYSIAMLLDNVRGSRPWSIMGSDISSRVLAKARRALYPMMRHENIPQEYLKRYCLRGKGEQEGNLLIDSALRRRVSFQQLNLTALPTLLGPFDVIFLRNVIIYFDLPTKQAVLRSVLTHLRPGGWLLVGHSESLHGMDLPIEQESPSIYRKRA